MFSRHESALPLVGLFVLAAGGAAILVGNRFVGSDPRLEAMARYAPMALALAEAEVSGAADIWFGANAVDYSGYPDCRPEFIRAFEGMANLATKAGVEGDYFSVHTPLLHMSKADIATQAARLGLDAGMSWSCYDPTPDNKACGRCDSCRLRAKGFADAGLPDPTIYA